VATIRAPKTGLATGALALLSAVGLTVFPLLASSKALPATVPLAFVGLAMLATGLGKKAHAAIVVAVAAIAGEYLTALHALGEELSLKTPLYAGGLVLTAELASWSAAETIRQTPRAGIAKRAFQVGLAAVASVAVAAAVVVTARSISGSSVWLEPVGLAAAAAAIFVIVLLGRRPAEDNR
jgi:hypothetical protein